MAKLAIKPNVLSIDQPFPDETALKSPLTWDRIMAAVTRSSARRHSSLSTEFVWIFGLTKYFISHHADFAKFCRSRGIAAPASVTPESMLSIILFQYTGNDRNGQQSASKYKNLIMPSLEEDLSVAKFKKRIADAGGVFGLAVKKRGAAKAKSSKMLSSVSEITEDDDYWVSVPLGETYTVELKANHGPKTVFMLTVSSEPDAAKNDIPFSKAPKLLVLDDDDDDDIED